MAKVRRIAYSNNTYGSLTVAQPVPQLYGTPYSVQEDELSGWEHRGSCLSASLEMVSIYQDRFSWPRSATLSVSQKAYPNSSNKIYYWNQSTIHHYVWGSKMKLMELVTAPQTSPREEPYGLGWIGLCVSKVGKKPGWRRSNVVAHLELKDFWDVVTDALDLDRIPIVSVVGMQFENPKKESSYESIPLPEQWTHGFDEILFYESNRNQFGERAHEEISDPNLGVIGRAPISRIREQNFNKDGHAMVIAGYCVFKGKRYVRLLDPAPSMRLRSTPYSLHEPDPWARDPRNHVQWVEWDELAPFVRDSVGLMIFRTDTPRRTMNQLLRMSNRKNIEDTICDLILTDSSTRRENRSVRY